MGQLAPEEWPAPSRPVCPKAEWWVEVVWVGDALDEPAAVVSVGAVLVGAVAVVGGGDVAVEVGCVDCVGEELDVVVA